MLVIQWDFFFPPLAIMFPLVKFPKDRCLLMRLRLILFVSRRISIIHQITLATSGLC